MSDAKDTKEEAAAAATSEAAETAASSSEAAEAAASEAGSQEQHEKSDQQVPTAQSQSTITTMVEAWDASAVASASGVAAASAGPITVTPVPTAPTTVVEMISSRSPVQHGMSSADRRMLYKVKFQAHLEDGRLVLLEDTIFEAVQMETTDMFLDAVSTLDVCKRILTVLGVANFHSDLVKVKVAFNEPGHGFKGRKQYLYLESDWRSMYSLFNSLRKKTTIYMTFDVRHKLKEAGRLSSVSPANQKPVVLRDNRPGAGEKMSSSPSTSASQCADQTAQSFGTPNGLYESSGEPLSKRLFQGHDSPRVVTSQTAGVPYLTAVPAAAATPTSESCGDCSNGTFRRLEARCNLRERLLAQLKAVAELSGGKVSEVDEEVLRKVQQDTLEDITLLCSQT